MRTGAVPYAYGRTGFRGGQHFLAGPARSCTEFDPDRNGFAICGRLLGPEAPVHQRNPGFDACSRCLAPFGGILFVEPTPVSARRPAPPRRPTKARKPARKQPSGSWHVPAGWVRLNGPSLVHWLHPEHADQVMCGQPWISAPVHRRPLRPTDPPMCRQCRKVRMAALDKEQVSVAGQGVFEQVAAQLQSPPRSRQRAAGTPTSNPPQPGWILLVDRISGAEAHRPHEHRPGRAMCGRGFDPGIPVRRRRPAKTFECPRCAQALLRTRAKAGIGKQRVTDPDKLDRTRTRSVSVRTVSGGLPTLGRRR
jgi:hypothetical protein